MAGAVAFVFGLCALSFAAGCVVTAVMLRRADPADEAPQPVAPPEPAGPPAPTPQLVWPPDDFAAKPIHRNPVVGLPALASLDHGDPAPAALALAPDPTFAGVFDPPPARLPDLVEEPLDQSPGGEPPTDALAEPAAGRVLHARSTANGYALRGRREPAFKRSPHAEQAILLKAARGPAPFGRTVQPVTLRVVADLPQIEPAEEVLPVESAVDESDHPVDAEAEKPVRLTCEPPVEPIAPVRQAITGPMFPTARNGKRREIKLELVPQSELKTPKPEAAASEVEATDGDAQQVVVPESETLFVSRSGLVTEPASDPEPNPAPAAEAVVPEQGVKQGVAPDDEFRKRYLRTFEAARRRSNH